jgi:hypothetical protein
MVQIGLWEEKGIVTAKPGKVDAACLAASISPRRGVREGIPNLWN